MKVQRIYYCEAPDCYTHVSTVNEYPTEGVSLIERRTDRELWVCSWDCVLKFAGTIPPMEVLGDGQ